MSNFLDDLPTQKFFEYFGISVGTLFPGILIIFAFAPDLFHDLTTGKLVLLSLSFTLPICALNSFVLQSRYGGKYNDEIMHSIMGLGGLLTGAIFYLSFISSFYLSKVLSFSRFNALLILVSLLELFSVIVIRKMKLEKSK